MKKRKMIGALLSLLIVAIICGIIALSFSFFLPRVKVNANYASTGQGVSPVVITYDECPDGTSLDDCATIYAMLYPGSDPVTKTFTVTNTGTESGKFNIYFKQLYNTFVDGDLVYTLYEVNGQTETTLIPDNGTSYIEVPYSNTVTYPTTPILSELTLNVNESRKFKIEISYLDRGESIDQESNRYAEFSIKLGIDTASGDMGTDTSGANEPVLGANMIPVVYDEDNGEWVKCDTTQISWYNYGNRIWANAVTVESGKRDYYRTASPDTIVDMDDIIGMYVWIPRFEYKILGTYGDGGSAAGTPGGISINFIPPTQVKATNKWTMHPAFTDGSQNNYIYGGWDKEITGFWYGKFEASGSYNSGNYLSSSIRVVPATSKKAVSSLRSMATYHQFMAAKSVSTYQGLGNTFDSHMSKNDEWGAVAYLSQSVYGKYGNSLYTGANKQVYINNYSSYYTGTSSGTPSAGQTSTLVVGNPSTTNGTEACYYDTLVDRGNGLGSCGGGASTTGNIYGVYDMNGGAWEYTMGYLEGTNGKTFDANVSASSTYQKNAVWGATSGSQYSAWSNALYSEKLQGSNHKYYNAYTTATASTACNGGMCYGHALSETAGWYGDYQSMISASYPWFDRGGRQDNGSSAGVFAFGGYNGYDNTNIGFRVVLT